MNKKQTVNHSIEKSSLFTEKEVMSIIADKAFDIHMQMIEIKESLSNRIRSNIMTIPIFMAAYISILPYTFDFNPVIMGLNSAGILLAFTSLVFSFVPLLSKYNYNYLFTTPKTACDGLKNGNSKGNPDKMFAYYLDGLEIHNKDNRKNDDKIGRCLAWSNRALFLSIVFFTICVTAYFLSGGRLWETKNLKINPPVTQTIIKANP